MESSVRKHSVNMASGKTSVSLEDDFWSALKEISRLQEISVPNLIARINQGRDNANLSSALRLFVLEYYQNRSRLTALSEPVEPERA